MTIFGHFWRLIPLIWGLRIFAREKKRHFLCFNDIQFRAKNKKDSTRSFWEKWADGGEFMGPILSTGRGPQKMTLSLVYSNLVKKHRKSDARILWMQGCPE